MRRCGDGVTCRCATPESSAGRGELSGELVAWQVDQLPPGPSSVSDAAAMPGPSRLPMATPRTRPSFRASPSSMAVASTWMASLKAWPV